MAITDSPGKTYELKMIGKRPEHSPYLQITEVDGQYIASISHASKLRSLANAILQSLDPQSTGGDSQ